MTKHKLSKASTSLLQEIVKLHKTMTTQDIYWFLRRFLIGSRQPMQAGFVLPTTVLVLLVVGLTVAALLFRTFSRTSQVIGQREQQKIYNAATPAIDRAKAKLENLFNNGEIPAGVPPEAFLMGKIRELDVPDAQKANTLPGETRLDLNGDGTLDNAWRYQDSTGNTVVYSILMNTQGQDSDDNEVTYIDTDLENKAAAMVVRSGPANTAQLTPACQIQNNQGDAAVEQGWFRDASSSAFLRKNFQINAVVLNTNSSASTKAVSTLELQQERQIDRGNKWGVWFRNDLEIFPGPSFRWNGSMHTEGSLFLGSEKDTNVLSLFRSYLISSPSSCIYGVDGIEPSEISINQQVDDDNQQVIFQGQVVSGRININDFQDYSSTIDRSPNLGTQLQKSMDSVQDTYKPIQIALDPLAIFTENKSRARNKSEPTNTGIRDKAAWDDKNLLATGDTQRIFNNQVPTPYLDDTYRADNIYGPKLPPDGLPTGTRAGDTIPSSDTQLVSNDPPADNPELLGLDGYWERRARLTGLRVIVGQRLELGNPLEVPKKPATFPTTRPHEALQRRTLRDNLAAVQATAIYHYENNPNNLDFPIACVATTTHPGTAKTLKNSATFEDITFTKADGSTETLRSDFFTGRGTNGWEYNVPDAATFPNDSMLRALRNLANFAGDLFGAFPAKQDSVIHPYPELTRYGNFSNLRRALANLDTNNSYSALSIADKSYLQTAACSLGMLANNIKVLQDYSYTSSIISSENGTTNLSALNLALASINGSSPEAVIAGMPGSQPTGTEAERRLVRLARLVYLKEQVEWDRLAPAIPNPLCTSLIAYGANLSKLCPTVQTPSSALYYIFPTIDHNEKRTDTYIISASVNPTSITTLYKASNNTALESIRLRPKPSISTWTLNTVNVTTNIDPLNTSTTYGSNTNVPNHRQESLIRYQPIAGNATVYRVPFKDTAPFNGREMMSVRVLNIDLDLLRRDNVDSDSWLPASGLIYAFREDAVREDAIARPEIETWNKYRNDWNEAGSPLNQRMNASPSSPQDPPLNADTGLSPKPIDYYPDPDRRPYGFRLKNGSELLRTNANNTFGLSFISDNSVYIQGNFNLHQNSSNKLLEEFAQYLQLPNWDNFYTRSTLDSEFGRAADKWRPSEIVADAVTILSDNFCDGSIEDGFTPKGTNDAPSNRNDVPLAQHGCGTVNGITSYLNQNRPNNNALFPLGFTWQQETPEPGSPIKISQNGAPVRSSGDYPNNNYQAFSDPKRRNDAQETRVNAIIVSGLVPSRVNQSYGGLHNFPRFLEDWKNGGVKLHISGSFIQLNFSSSATGPFDQDAWERTNPSPTKPEPTSPDEIIKYYEPPARLWGYDVGLQYQPPGSVSRRFTTPGITRSEFYKELSVDDPYILMLRCASEVDGDQVDPNASCS